MARYDQPLLAVDLDGTLLRSDMLFESFWSACGRRWWQPFATLRALARGRAGLKRYLAEHACIDVATLPYDATVIEYIRRFQDVGGRTVLVTAADELLARRIADHLGIFDEVHGSDGVINLKADRKAAFLNDRYGVGRYAYMGDSRADLAVWAQAGHAVTVNAPSSLRDAVAAMKPAAEHLSSMPTVPSDYLRAIRPHQWLKNILVFMPMLAAHVVEIGAFAASLMAFMAFSLIASSVYVLNDLLDLAADRAHPRKRERPFASGRIPIAHGTWLAGGLFLAGAVVSLALGPAFFLVMAGYYLLTTAYSLALKRRVVIDICVLAGLYTLRIIAGGVATGLTLSVWILAFSIFFFFALAAVKRQAELVDSGRRGKLAASGRGYAVEDLPVISMMAIGAGYVSVLVMALYVNAPSTQELYTRPEALWGICCVLLYWISRTVLLAHRGQMHDDPVVYAAKDRISLLCFLLILGFGSVGLWP
ncbi:UbiA family prenyltransferase [Rhodovulum steppense]|uniref:4-hydroxybenzoate polyprenyltransferase n=1 Tax=Rhodovulum steppense TaxID=540251 RepID=A0A4R1YN54_9RHOB|nr:UbiA family prenyltransferase [Rhodovulum steppense]TCM78977.1 4-hydroxybenzoate polyprenyltransferase [Rhodovulum steppense]